MNRRKFAATTLTGLVAALFGATKAKADQNTADLIKDWRSHPTHHTTTLYAGAEAEKLIDENAKMIRQRLVAMNVMPTELDAIDAAYRHSMRQRLGKKS